MLLRGRRFRAKQAALGKARPRPITPTTREANRLYKQASRAKMTMLQRMALRNYDRIRKRERRHGGDKDKVSIMPMGIKKHIRKLCIQQDQKHVNKRITWNRRRGRRKERQDKSKHIQLIKDICDKLKENRGKNVQKKQIYRLIANKYNNINRASTVTGVSWNTLSRSMTEESQIRSDALTDKERDDIHDFYVRPTVSISLPDHKSANKKFVDRTLKQPPKMKITAPKIQIG